MRKLIILLLFVNIASAQYNLFARQNFAYKVVSNGTNTEIGGVASTIGTPTLLASKLGILESKITNFTIVGSDIKCKITGSYVIPGNAFLSNTSITYYYDNDNLVTDLLASAFRGCNSLKKVVFDGVTTLTGSYIFREIYVPTLVSLKNCTNITSNAFDEFYNKGGYIYIPNCTTLGSTVLSNVVFNSQGGNVLQLNPFLATSNAGAEEGDVALARTQGSIIRYVTNFTAPNPITTLAVGTIYNTAVQLNFTAPIGSTNAIEYYECYANGVLKNIITTSGQYITGLTASTSYNITLIAVDIFYNKSVVSNSLSTATNTTSAIPTTGLISYYKLETNSNDNFGANNGTDTSVSYVSGKVGNAASYNGSSSKTNVANPVNLQLTTLSISCWIKSSGAGTGDRGLIFKRYAYNIFFYNNKLATYSYGSPSGYKDTGVNVCDGTWKHLAITQQSGVTDGTKIYINGQLILTTTVGQTAQTDVLEFGTIAGAGFANFILDETNIYNVVLNQDQIQLIYNNGNGTTL